MIVINYKICCDDCPHRDYYVREEEIWADNSPIKRTEIGCTHEVVCKEYREAR